MSFCGEAQHKAAHFTRAEPVVVQALVQACDPAGAQTQNLQNRNLTLYSIELRGLRRNGLRYK